MAERNREESSMHDDDMNAILTPNNVLTSTFAY